jgi:hypothetical protein
VQRRALFLDAFAATGDLDRAARGSGLRLAELFRQRREDADFREQWDQAQQQNYVALEAGLVLLARRTVETWDTAEPDKVRAGGMDPKLAFAVLQHSLKKPAASEDAPDQGRSDLSEATRRLEGVMGRMKLLPPPESVRSSGTDVQ